MKYTKFLYIFSVKLDLEEVRRLSSAKGWSLVRLLREAGVSPNAFYTLSRKTSVLPRSVHRLASSLGVPAERVLMRDADPESRARELLRELKVILERLRRGLLRAQTGDLHR